jgi:hypothetical protein
MFTILLESECLLSLKREQLWKCLFWNFEKRSLCRRFIATLSMYASIGQFVERAFLFLFFIYFF